MDVDQSSVAPAAVSAPSSSGSQNNGDTPVQESSSSSASASATPASSFSLASPPASSYAPSPSSSFSNNNDNNNTSPLKPPATIPPRSPSLVPKKKPIKKVIPKKKVKSAPASASSSSAKADADDDGEKLFEVKKPISAYFRFFSAFVKTLTVEQKQEISATSRGGAAWQAMSVEDRKPYQDAYDSEMVGYSVKVKGLQAQGYTVVQNIKKRKLQNAKKAKEGGGVTKKPKAKVKAKAKLSSVAVAPPAAKKRKVGPKPIEPDETLFADSRISKLANFSNNTKVQSKEAVSVLNKAAELFISSLTSQVVNTSDYYEQKVIGEDLFKRTLLTDKSLEFLRDTIDAAPKKSKSSTSN
jgi:hypothetical protein